MSHYWIGATLLVLTACVSDSPSMRQTASPNSSPASRGCSAEVVVSGDVGAMLIDEKGRRAGWEGHRVEEIPGCTLGIVADEIAEPTRYSFRWDRPVNGTYRLELMARTDGDLVVSASATAGTGKNCEKRVTEAMAEQSVGYWRVGLKATRSRCEVLLSRAQR